jgi:hypothetical protein
MTEHKCYFICAPINGAPRNFQVNETPFAIIFYCQPYFLLSFKMLYREHMYQLKKFDLVEWRPLQDKNIRVDDSDPMKSMFSM